MPKARAKAMIPEIWGETMLLPPGLSGLFIVSTGLFSIYIAFIGIRIVTNVFFHPLSSIPGPYSRAAFEFPDILSNLRGTASWDKLKLHDLYGPIVRVRPNELSFNSAQAWKDIYGLKKDRTEFGKDLNYYRFGRTSQIINAHQRDHARLRRSIAPAFSDSALADQEPLMNRYFDLLISNLSQSVNTSDRGGVDIAAQYTFAAFDIIGDLALGESFNALESGKEHPWMRNFFESIKFLGIIRLATTYPLIGIGLRLFQFLRPVFAERRHAHMDFTRAKIDNRVNRVTNRKDFLHYICRSKCDQDRLTHKEILGNMRVLLTAGSESTANTLAGATFYLLTHPAALHRAQVEVRSTFQRPEDISLRSLSTPGSLPFLNAVIEETLRCYPPVPSLLPRVTNAPGAVIDGCYVPMATTVSVHHWSASRSASNFVAANDFVPERWLSREAPIAFSRDKKDAMQPFSLGPRGCLGRSLGYFEIRSILARVLWHFEMQLEDKSRHWIIQKEYAFWDKPALWVRLSHRTSACN